MSAQEVLFLVATWPRSRSGNSYGVAAFYMPLLTTLAILTFAKDFTLWLPRMIAQ